MVLTVGIHLIWTCYGTWLPGDDRGHWSALFDLYGDLIRAGHQLNMPDEVTTRRAMELMKEEPRVLRDDEPDIVAATMAQYLAPALAGGTAAYACAIESNHVHLLVGPVHEPIERFAGRLKGTSSSALLKRPDNWDRKRSWTTGYWKVFLFDLEAMRAVVQYIEAHNARRVLPASAVDWLQPLPNIWPRHLPGKTHDHPQPNRELDSSPGKCRG